MTDLSDLIAGLLGGRSGVLSSLLPGGMPGDPSYRRPPGYDPDAAQWAQVSRALLEAGARVASAPRGQAVGQGLRGFIEGGDAGRQAYEDALLNAIKRREIETQAREEEQGQGTVASPNESIAIPDRHAPFAALERRRSIDGASIACRPGARNGPVPTDVQIDQMPLSRLWQIDPAQLSESQRLALSRRLFREGF
jgi:hypothetical protein